MARFGMQETGQQYESLVEWSVSCAPFILCGNGTVFFCKGVQPFAYKQAHLFGPTLQGIPSAVEELLLL